MKLCKSCNKIKEAADFNPRSDHPKYLRSHCKECCSKKGLERYRKLKPTRLAIARRYQLKKLYGITPEQVEEMRAKQKGCCGSCQEPYTELHVDHDHLTGKVRQLLCRSCNNGLGCFMDDVSRLEKAIEYLKRNSS